MTTENCEKKTRKRLSVFSRIFRFRLRTILIFVTLIGVFVGPELNQQSRQNNAIPAIRSKPTTWLQFAHEVEDSEEWRSRLPPIRTSLTRRVGQFFKTDYFNTAVRLYLRVDAQIDVNQIGNLKHLVWLQVGTDGTWNLEADKTGADTPALEPIGNCKHLQYLVLGDWFKLWLGGTAGDRGTGMTLLPYDLDESDLSTIANLKKLRVLAIGGRGVSDESIQQLSGLRTLEYLYLSRAKVSASGVARLRELLPNVSVVEMNDSDLDYSSEVPSRF